MNNSINIIILIIQTKFITYFWCIKVVLIIINNFFLNNFSTKCCPTLFKTDFFTDFHIEYNWQHGSKIKNDITLYLGLEFEIVFDYFINIF